MILDQHYTTQKTHVIKAERRVLKELGFCVHVKHPHKVTTTTAMPVIMKKTSPRLTLIFFLFQLIVMYLQVLNYEKNDKLMQLSW